MTAVVVTGASRGIGRATALLLAERGCDLVLIGRPSAELAATEREAKSRGVSTRVLHCDLARAVEVEAVAGRVLESGTPRALINNAAVIRRTAVETLDTAAWDEQLAVNLTAPFLLSRALLPAFRRAGSGAIVNVGSIAGTMGTARASAYCASKWGLTGFTKSLAEELADSGVMAVAILPGSVDTRMLVDSGFSPRMTAEDVARTIVYFALEAPLAHNGGVVEMFGT
jgi:3-oxoacyl-[acyl-carrier protein] reductase